MDEVQIEYQQQQTKNKIMVIGAVVVIGIIGALFIMRDSKERRIEASRIDWVK
jgi:hypothetical protein